MSRLSFRPRPLDIHKKLPIVKSVKEFEDDDTPTTSSTRNSQLLRLASDVDNEEVVVYVIDGLKMFQGSRISLVLEGEYCLNMAG
ncbi:hypothetical protein CJ030_MR5G023944 [Morella rubra]|uniref:Uncharacterized protein n=1 Tax=Morella rubra TaxID=262757 RepID=A0A6A1VPD3_9ROSI|nr:hypothetical protein CJ030_MR5G023944 [Morella rubra]